MEAFFALGDAELQQEPDDPEYLPDLLPDVHAGLSDFRQYAIAHFQPDTFVIVVRSGEYSQDLAFFDRYDRHFEGFAPQNLKGYRFPIDLGSCAGQLYLGYDGDHFRTFEQQKHIFSAFRERISSYLKRSFRSRRCAQGIPPRGPTRIFDENWTSTLKAGPSDDIDFAL
jgi:hypothetical protein